MTEQNREGEFISALISPEDYSRQVNQVATVWTNQLRFIRRKEFALQPFGVEIVPMSTVKSVKYRQAYAAAPFVLGILGLVIVALVFALPIPGGTRVPVGALFLLGLGGFTWVRGVKRHRLDFQTANRVLTWRSKAGDFNTYKYSVSKVTAFARQAGLLAPDSQPIPSEWSN